MTTPRTDRPYKLYTDACDYAVGAILVQVDDSGILKGLSNMYHTPFQTSHLRQGSSSLHQRYTEW